MSMLRRAAVAVAAAVLSIGIVGAAAPAHAADTSWPTARISGGTTLQDIPR